MDIEKMQKINKMARELVQHGVVSDMQEASKQAELMINRGDKGIADVMNIEQKEERSPEAKQKRDGVEVELRMLKSQLNEQTKTIRGLADQLEQIKQDMGKLKGMREQKPIMVKEPQKEQTELKKEEVKKAEPHPKVGKYDPDDVSIEKFFYSGPPKD